MEGYEHKIAGYTRCLTCGTLVPDAYATISYGLCPDHADTRSPLKVIEVLNRGSRSSLRVNPRKERSTGKTPRGRKTPESARLSALAREAAWRRLAQLHPDLYQMLYDEERVRRGLFPIGRYNAAEHPASETLGFDDVYAALRSTGDTDA